MVAEGVPAVVMPLNGGVVDKSPLSRTGICLSVVQHRVRPAERRLVIVGAIKILSAPIGGTGFAVEDKLNSGHRAVVQERSRGPDGVQRWRHISFKGV